MFVIPQTHPPTGCLRGSVRMSRHITCTSEQQPAQSTLPHQQRWTKCTAKTWGQWNMTERLQTWTRNNCKWQLPEVQSSNKWVLELSTPAHSCSLIGSNCQNWVHVGAACPCLPVHLLFLAGGVSILVVASKMISSFRPASKPLSKPWLSVCWGTAGSPNAISTWCVWASPLATLAWARVGRRGYPNLFFFVCLSVVPSCVRSVSLSPHLPPLWNLSIFPNTSLSLCCLFTLSITRLRFPTAIFSPFLQYSTPW